MAIIYVNIYMIYIYITIYGYIHGHMWTYVVIFGHKHSYSVTCILWADCGQNRKFCGQNDLLCL